MKNRLRKYYKSVIASKDKDYVSIKLLEFINKDNIGIYLDIKNEISIDNIIEKVLLTNKKLYVPYMKDKGNGIENACFEFRKLEDECLDDFGIRSSKGEIINVNNLDIIVVPGVCFNKNGYRMGYGKGCYDKVLKDYRGMIIGVCYDDCFIDDRFEEEHDIKVNYVFTEKGYYKIRG